MSKIVYLIGAGASFGKRDKDGAILEGLPIVEEFPKRILEMIAKIQSEDTEAKSQHKATPKQKGRLVEELQWLKKSGENHQTVDTFAKKLYLTDNKPDYKRLKNALSAYLTLEQLFKKPDSRYDAFIASLLTSSTEDFPNDISILSWNYDCQFEIAYSEYIGKADLNHIWRKLNIANKTTFIDLGHKKEFNLTKLNGSALIFDNDRNASLSPLFDPHFNRQGMSEINYVCTLYFEGKDSQNTENALSFAWEELNNDFLKTTLSSIEDAEILVVIGYSFPYFNRKIDKQIIGKMSNLKKVYIQDPNSNEIKENFEAALSDSQTAHLADITFVHRNGVKQFVIPNEM